MTDSIQTTAQPVMETAVSSPVTEGNGKKKLLKIIGIVTGILLVLSLAGFLFLRLFLERVPPKKTTELTYWGFWLDEDKIRPLLSEYEAQTGIKVNYIKQAKQDFRERLVNSLAQGRGPDVFSFHNSWVPMFKTYLGKLPQEVMDNTVFESTFYPTVISDLHTQDGYVGLPLQFDGLALFVTSQTYPTTWDEFRKLASSFTSRDKDGRITKPGAAIGRTDNVDHWQDIFGLLLLQGGIDPANLDPSTSAQVFEFYTIFERLDRVWDETFPSSTQAFANGQVPMYFGPAWKINEIKKINPSLSFKVIPVPQLPKISSQDKDVNWASYWAEGVWNKSPHAKEAWELLKFLSAKESLSRLSGFPYSRQDMQDLQKDDPFLGAFIKEAPTARSWYLASETYDGQTGINTRLSQAFSQAINTILNKGSIDDAVKTLASEVKKVLLEYGLYSTTSSSS